eukprot:Gb_24703 [translate_table: standard]
MVMALYNMNKAYLSLPDRIGSVAGFVAMMIDHYNMLDVSNSDKDYAEDYEGSECPRQLKSRLRNTHRFEGYYSSLLHSRTTPSSFGSSRTAKRRTAGSRARVVGKRTPRFHVSYIIEKKKKPETVQFCKEEPCLGSDGDYNDNEVAKTAALTLTEASLRAISPQVSRTPTQRKQDMKYSPAQNGDLKGKSAGYESGGSGARDFGAARVECPLEGYQGSREERKRVTAKSSISVSREKFVTTGSKNNKSKMKKPPRKFLKLQGLELVHSDDARGECGNTVDVIGVEEKDKFFDIGVIEKKGKKPLSQYPRKRSRQLFSGDGNFGLNALATLADLSLNGSLPPPAVDSDLSMQFQEEKNDNFIHEKAKVGAEEVRDSDLHVEKPKISLEQERGQDRNVVNSVESMAKQKDDEDLLNGELKGQHTTSLAEFKKRKRKAAAEKTQQVEALGESCSGETKKVDLQISLGGERKAGKKPKQMAHTNSLLKQRKLLRPVEVHAFVPELAAPAGCTTEPVSENTAINQATLSNQYHRRQKMAAEKADRGSEYGARISAYAHCEPVSTAGTFCSPMTDGIAMMKAKLTHCLSSAKVRRWCAYEWFYSAIDLPWFGRNEFLEYLNHAGLGRVPRLTRVEWGVIRSSLGKPRRLSKRFLQEEREKLAEYRETVRKLYNAVRLGVCDGLPTDLALPLSAGQRVIACHPKTRKLHDGCILTVDQSRYRVQFDRPELGVEFVLDIDCMPVNLLENMPETLRRKRIILDGLGQSLGDAKLDIESRVGWSVRGDARSTLDERLDTTGAELAFSQLSKYPFKTAMDQTKVDKADFVKQAKAAGNELLTSAQQAMYNWPCTLAQVQAREADIRALADLTRALDKKEALIVELRHMNDDISKSEKKGGALRNSQVFRKQYASVLVQLKVANDQVTSALKSLRKRNTYQVNMIPPSNCAISHSLRVGGSSCLEHAAPLSFDAIPHVGEIADNAKRKAKQMVDAAMQAMSSLTEDEDAIVKIDVALDCATNSHAKVDRMKVGLRSSHFDSTKQTDGEILDFYEGSTVMFGPELTADDASDEKKDVSSDRKEGLLLADLTASCVATLLMIQTCSDSHFPPSDVAHVLDNAVRSLQPYSTTNLIIYKEIQQCIAIVKNQILALIPTQPSISVSTDIPSGHP